MSASWLLTLYASTRGGWWYNNNGWLSGADPCTWHGVGCDRGNVTSIDLTDNGLHGPLPTELGLASSLERLAVARSARGIVAFLDPIEYTRLPSLSNQLQSTVFLAELGGSALTGTLPTELAGLPSLRELNVWGNHLSGTLPDFHHTPSESLRIEINRISGTLPADLGGPNLTALQAGINRLSGTLPTSYGARFSNARFVELESNFLSGTLPVAWAGMANLRTLTLWLSRVSGTLPTEYAAGMRRLFELTAMNTALSGSVPSEYAGLNHLAILSAPTRWLFSPAFECIPFELAGLSAWGGTVRSSVRCDEMASFWTITAVFAVLPILITVAWELAACWRARARSGRSGREVRQGDASSLDIASIQLDLLTRARFDAAALRRRVSGVLMSAGTALFIVGIAIILHFVSRFRPLPEDALGMAWPLSLGMLLMFLAVMPTDERMICVLTYTLMIFYLILALALILGPTLGSIAAVAGRVQ